MEITQDKSYRLLLRSGRNHNLKIKATESFRGRGGVIAPKAREKLEAKLKGGWVCLKNVDFVIHSTDSVLALGH